jgi:hypothetical protein
MFCEAKRKAKNGISCGLISAKPRSGLASARDRAEIPQARRLWRRAEELER